MHHSFWAHYCPCEKGLLWVAQDEECNWCGLTCDPVLAEGESDIAETTQGCPPGAHARPSAERGATAKRSGR
ncbi:MAG TPA: hypothetical protein VHL98_05345 [Microvirga sp.]|jgi:hypothetical protein|nr:hypothetical protein [Microvirga sp.]